MIACDWTQLITWVKSHVVDSLRISGATSYDAVPEQEGILPAVILLYSGLEVVKRA